jgi:hypothetical protein
MADYNSSLPIRTESAGDAVIKVCDATVTTQQLKVNSDGSIDTNISATDLDIRDLTHASDSVKIGDGTDFLAVNNDGSINATVSATDLDIRDLAAATDSVSAWLKDSSGSAFSPSNPLPVTLTSGTPGDEINNYSTATVASAATSNHDYTVTALKTLNALQVHASASGKMKIEVQVETGVGAGTYLTKFVLFNSTANPNMIVNLSSVLTVAAGVKVRVARTNLDKSTMDVYSTISGIEV